MFPSIQYTNTVFFLKKQNKTEYIFDVITASACVTKTSVMTVVTVVAAAVTPSVKSRTVVNRSPSARLCHTNSHRHTHMNTHTVAALVSFVPGEGGGGKETTASTVNTTQEPDDDH